MTKSDYPMWVCLECGEKARKKSKTKRLECSSIHPDICDVCGKMKWCTEPRDFGYPNFDRVKEKK